MIKRNRKGQFIKGISGNPTGRRKKKEVMGVPIAQARQVFAKVFTAVFNKSGDWKELVEFVEKNQLNMRLFLQEYRKLIPEATPGDPLGPGFTVSDKFLPKVTINRIITDRREDVMSPGEIEEEKKKAEKKLDPSGPKAMTDEELRKGIDELEKKKADILTALAEKRPDKSKAVN